SHAGRRRRTRDVARRMAGQRSAARGIMVARMVGLAEGRLGGAIGATRAWRGTQGLQAPGRRARALRARKIDQKISGSEHALPKLVSRKSRSQPASACKICCENIQP